LQAPVDIQLTWLAAAADSLIAMTATNLDPRIASSTVIAGPSDALGLNIRVERVVIDGLELDLPKAHPGVSNYVSVAHSETRADSFRGQLVQALDHSGPVPYQPNFGLVLDFQSSCGTAVAEAIVGVEAFTNHHLARFVPHGGTLTYNGRAYTLPQARDISINERVGEVLPSLYGKAKPTSEPWWPVFRRVQGLAALARHGVDEPVTRNGLTGEKPLLQRLCDREYSGAAAMMLNLFAYFEPRWVSPERLEQLPRPPNP
jgi:hypothetical protein